MKKRLAALLALAAVVSVTALTVTSAAPAASPTASITNQINATTTNIRVMKPPVRVAMADFIPCSSYRRVTR